MQLICRAVLFNFVSPSLSKTHTGIDWHRSTVTRNKDTERENMPLYMKYTSLFTRGGTSCNLRVQFLLAISSLNMRMPPEIGEKREEKRKPNEPTLFRSLSQSMKPSLLSARHAITHNLLSVVPGMRSASRWRINEMPRWRERNCLYNLSSRCPCGISENKSHEENIAGLISHWRWKLCYLQLIICFFFVHWWKWAQLLSCFLLPKAPPQSPKVTGKKRFNCMPHCQLF